MDKISAYNALQGLVQQIGRRVDEGSIGADEVAQILASGRDIAGQVGLNPDAIEAWLQRAQGGGISTPDVPGMGVPLEVAKAAFDRSELPTSGVTFDQFLSTIGSNVDGGMVSEPTAPIDWMRGDNSSLLQNAIKFAGLAAAGYGLGTGLESLVGNAGAAAAAPGSSLLDPSLITSPVAPVSTGAAYGTADPFLQGVTQTMPTTLGASVPAGSTLGTAAPFTSGLGAAASSAIPGLSEAIQQAATEAGGAAGSGLATGLGGAAAAPAAAAGMGAGTGLGEAAAASALGGAASGLGSPSTPPATMPNPGAPAATASEIAGTTTPAATGSSLSQYLQSLGMPAGIADLLTPQNIGAIGSSLLGVLGSRDQASAYRDTANQFLNMGAPYRDRLASLYANPESYTTGPEMQGVMKAFNQSLSAQYGNPYMSPTATAQSVSYGLGALGKEKDRLAGYGGLGFNPSGVAGLSAQGASNSGTYNALGAGLAQLTQPQNTLNSTMEDLLRAQTRRLNTGSGL